MATKKLQVELAALAYAIAWGAPASAHEMAQVASTMPTEAERREALSNALPLELEFPGVGMRRSSVWEVELATGPDRLGSMGGTALPDRAPRTGLSLGVGEVSVREYELFATTAIGFNLGSVSYTLDGYIGALEVALQGGLTASPAHSTHSRLERLRGFSANPSWCATQSEVFLGLILRFREASLSLFSATQGDPFHFGDGDGCIGDPPAWVEGHSAGARMRFDVSSWMEVEGSLRMDDYTLTWRVDGHGDDLLGTRARTTTAFVLVRLRT
jgi:hypothetical protein